MPRKSVKRENGSGSVYKRSDIKRRPWVAIAPAKLNLVCGKIKKAVFWLRFGMVQSGSAPRKEGA